MASNKGLSGENIDHRHPENQNIHIRYTHIHMNENIMLEGNNKEFKDFLLKNRRNRITLYLIAISLAFQLAIFKYFYPYPSFIHGDSFNYLETAYKNLSINSYMAGYGWFLRLFSVFTKSDTILVTFQYLFIQSSCLFLLFSIFFLYKPSKNAQVILLCFMIFNPLFLYLANLISSDGIFLGLSLYWITLLLWIVHQPSTAIIISHALILFIAFTVRYNAFICLPIVGIAFWLSKMPTSKKVIGFASSIALVTAFIIYSGNEYKILTGKWQYSPFSGWLLANNAMYAYRYVDSASRKSVPEKYRVLDNMIRTYFDSTRDIQKHPEESVMASTFYMWDSRLPLFKYFDLQGPKDSSNSEFKRWASIGPFYREYGLYLIKLYPMHFAKYFLWPNAIKYYSPPIEFLETYNSDKDSIPTIAQIWFGYNSRKLTLRLKDRHVYMLNFYPILCGVINVVMLFSLLSFALLYRQVKSSIFYKGVLVVGMVWVINAGFTMFASSVALRFQAFPIILTTTFVVLLLDYMIKLSATSKRQALPNTLEGKFKNVSIENF